MSPTATLEMTDATPMKVLSCDWQFAQMTDAIGKPVSIPRGGSIHVTVAVDGSDFLFHWMKEPTLQKEGTLTFYQADGIRPLRSVTFEDAICTGYLETFDYLGINPQQIHLTISARKLTIGNTEHTNPWPETFKTADNPKTPESEKGYTDY